MLNLRMEDKIKKGEAIDLSGRPRNEEGDYVLEQFTANMDYCDAVTESWIWSIGQDLKTGLILASASGKFYNNPAFKCLWLR